MRMYIGILVVGLRVRVKVGGRYALGTRCRSVVMGW